MNQFDLEVLQQIAKVLKDCYDNNFDFEEIADAMDELDNLVIKVEDIIEAKLAIDEI